MRNKVRNPLLFIVIFLCLLPLLCLVLPRPIARLIPAAPWIYCKVSNGYCPVLLQQSRYSEALRKAETAFTCAQEFDSPIEQFGSIACMESAYVGQSRYDEFLEITQQALVIAYEQDEPMLVGASLADMGFAYLLLGRYSEALESLKEALAIHREIDYRSGQAIALTNLGNVYLAQGDHERALAHYQQALDICREEERWDFALMPFFNMALVYETQWRIAEAMAHYELALDLVRQAGSPDQEAMILTNMANLQTGSGHYREALEMYEGALEVHHRVGNPAGEAMVLHNIGALCLSGFRDHNRAMEYFQRSLDLAREMENPAGEKISLISIGNVFLEQGNYKEAENRYQQALDIARKQNDQAGEVLCLRNIGATYQVQMRYEDALGKYQEALAIAQELADYGSQVACLGNIGSVYKVQERYDEALDIYIRAADIAETIRPRVGSQQSRAVFDAATADLYAHTVDLLHQLGQTELAFLTGERGRARSFLDSLATKRVVLTDDELASRIIAGNPNTAWLQDAIAMEIHDDHLTNLVADSSVISHLADVQAHLDEQTTLLSYFVLEDKTLVFVITQQDFVVVEIQISRQALTNQIRGLRKSIEDHDLGNRQIWSKKLYQALIDPVSGYLQTQCVVIIPHGYLHYLPFAALQHPDTKEYLIERHTLVSLPSASTLPFIEENARGRELASPLVLGNPRTDADLPPLRFAEQEALAIAALYGAEPLLGEVATESAARERAGQAGILHLAAHGNYTVANPLFSAIVLARDDNNDGRLEVHEVYGLDLRQTDLVVLSACQTQLGELSAGDEVVGLTRAFFFAGTPTVVASLWNVDDAATTQLMVSFYTHLREGMGKAAAMRQAQLDLLREETYADPYYWSAFVLSGDGGS